MRRPKEILIMDRPDVPPRVEWTLKAPAGNLLLLPTQSIVSLGWWMAVMVVPKKRHTVNEGQL